jgi:YD repeat-containing protein
MTRARRISYNETGALTTLNRNPEGTTVMQPYGSTLEYEYDSNQLLRSRTSAGSERRFVRSGKFSDRGTDNAGVLLNLHHT